MEFKLLVQGHTANGVERCDLDLGYCDTKTHVLSFTLHYLYSLGSYVCSWESYYLGGHIIDRSHCCKVLYLNYIKYAILMCLPAVLTLAPGG